MTIINWSTEYSIILVNFLGQEREENKYKTNKQTNKKKKKEKTTSVIFVLVVALCTIESK